MALAGLLLLLLLLMLLMLLLLLGCVGEANKCLVTASPVTS